MNCFVEDDGERLERALAALPALERGEWERRLGFPPQAAPIPVKPLVLFGWWRVPNVPASVRRWWRQELRNADRRCYLEVTCPRCSSQG